MNSTIIAGQKVSDLYFEFEKDRSFKRTQNNRSNIAFNFADNSFIGDSETRALHGAGFQKLYGTAFENRYLSIVVKVQLIKLPNFENMQ